MQTYHPSHLKSLWNYAREWVFLPLNWKDTLFGIVIFLLIQTIYNSSRGHKIIGDILVFGIFIILTIVIEILWWRTKKELPSPIPFPALLIIFVLFWNSLNRIIYSALFVALGIGLNVAFRLSRISYYYLGIVIVIYLSIYPISFMLWLKKLHTTNFTSDYQFFTNKLTINAVLITFGALIIITLWGAAFNLRNLTYIAITLLVFLPAILGAINAPGQIAFAILLVSLDLDKSPYYISIGSKKDLRESIAFGEEEIPIWCEGCNSEGYIRVSDGWKPYFVVCEKCGHETSMVSCDECQMGGEFVRNIADRSTTYTCPNCKRQYEFPQSLYDNPIPLHIYPD